MGCGVSTNNNNNGNGTTKGSSKKKKPAQIFLDTYRIINKTPLGRGAFGAAFEGEHIQTGDPVCLKVASKPKQCGKLAKENLVLEEISSQIEVVPRHYGFHDGENKKAIVMELLGPSLEDVLELVNPGIPALRRRFTIPTVLVIGIHCVRTLNALHSCGYIHCDVKPHNFLMGCSPTNNKLYMIDFGLCRKYVDDQMNHIQQEYSGSSFTAGTPVFASRNAHKGLTLSRKDDMESLAFLLISFVHGLPWVQDDSNDYHYASSKAPGFNELQEMKIEMGTSKKLGKDLPKELREFIDYCMKLKFDQTPDYAYLEGLLLKLLGNQRKVYKERIGEMVTLNEDDEPQKGEFGVMTSNVLPERDLSFVKCDWVLQQEAEEQQSSSEMIGKGVESVIVVSSSLSPATSSEEQETESNAESKSKSTGNGGLSGTGLSANLHRSHLARRPRSYSDPRTVQDFYQ